MFFKPHSNSKFYSPKGPKQVRLEASTNCQLKCPSCPTTKGIIKNNIGGGFLKFEDFKKFLDLNPSVTQIELSNWGEIFLNPELLKIMEYAHSKNVLLEAGNGVNLNHVREEVLEGLVKYQFRRLNCSIDGTSQEIYQKYRVTGELKRVIQNIERINHYKKVLKSTYPKLEWQFVVFGHNEHEIPEAKRLAAALGMKIRFKLNWDASFSPVKNPEFVRSETKLSSASVTDFAKANSRLYKSDICLQLWNNPQINFDGTMLGCCVNHWGNFGNVFESGLSKILYGEKMSYARAMLMGRAPERKDIPCSTCSKFKALKTKDAWFLDHEVPSISSRTQLHPRVLWWNLKQIFICNFWSRRTDSCQ